MSTSFAGFIEMLVRSDLITEAQLEEIRRQLGSGSNGPTDESLANQLAESGHLSGFQANEVRSGNVENLVIGDYVILHPVGRGGMGEVFRARHSVMKREVAVKFVLPDDSGHVNQAAVDRFQREVEAASRLMHPNIVNSLDAGRRGETCYLVMEYIQGLSLSQYIRSEGPMSWLVAIDAVTQVAQGLDFAHSSGVIHRDIKPANLLISKSGNVKILDMGLVRMKAEPEEIVETADICEEQLTRSGHLLGTVDFMSPEQAIDASSADARSDIYSLGCTMFYLLTGKAPFRNETNTSAMSRIIAHRENPIPLINEIRTDVPEIIQEVLEKMLAKDPKDRFQTANELILTLRKIKAMAESGELPIDGQHEQQRRDQPTSMRRLWFVAGSIAAAGVAGFSIISTEIWPVMSAIENPSEHNLTIESDKESKADIAPITGSVDLLDQADLKNNVVSGNDWWLKDRLLYVPPSTPSKLLLPVALPTEFQFDVQVKRVIPSGPFVIGVNSYRCHCYLIIDVDRNHRGSHMIALGTLNGRIAKSTLEGIELPMEESVDLTLIVNADGLTLTSADEPIFSWEGDATKLELGAGWGVGSTEGLFIGSNGGTAFEVTRLTVQPLGLEVGDIDAVDPDAVDATESQTSKKRERPSPESSLLTNSDWTDFSSAPPARPYRSRTSTDVLESTL